MNTDTGKETSKHFLAQNTLEEDTSNELIDSNTVDSIDEQNIVDNLTLNSRDDKTFSQCTTDGAIYSDEELNENLQELNG